MDNIPGGRYFQGGGKSRPYSVRPMQDMSYRSRVGAGLAQLSRALVTHLLFASFFLCAGVALLFISSSQRVLAQGNTFIVTIMGSAQQPGFAPNLLSVHIYDTVVFVNAAATSVAITAADNSFSSPAIAPGRQWKVTFNSVGAFEYHGTSTPAPHIFGEIVVVPDAVALLPSPAPAAQQTAIAYIQAGKFPPDTVWHQAAPSVQTPVSASPFQNRTTRSLSVPPLSLLVSFVRPVILVVIVLFALFAAGLGGLWLYRRRGFRKKDDEEDEEVDANE